WSITIDSTQRKWIGFQGYGVDVIAPDNENWLNFSENTEDNRIAGDIVNDIVEARNGDIWLAIEPNTFSEFASQGVTAISGLTATNSSPTQSSATTTFTATVTYGSGVAYTWDFGDGTAPATGVTATHAYQTAGNYTAVVTASNQVNQVTATTTVTINSGSADLIVEKKGPAEVAAGGILIYEIAIANQGTSPATEIVLTDTLPTAVTFITQTSSYPYTYDPILGTVAWSIDYLAAGVTESFLLQAQVALNASDVLTNTVTGVMATNDPTPLNNQDTHATVVLPPILG